MSTAPTPQIARIRYSPDGSEVEVITPDGQSFLDDVDDDPLIICSDDDDASKPAYVAVLAANDWGLVPGKVYQFVEVPTEVERNCVDLLETE
jgi:hypothetical protein